MTRAAAPLIAATLAILVRWGGDAGSEAFRTDLERSLDDALVGSCFAHVNPAEDDPAAAKGDLVLTLVLSNVQDETRFDDSIAAALNPGEPTNELRREARFAVDVAASVVATASGATVVERRLHADASRRPVMIGEDPQAYARARAIERIVGDVRKALCGSAGEKRIRQALSGSPAR
jgi:hypothetical protein